MLAEVARRRGRADGGVDIAGGAAAAACGDGKGSSSELRKVRRGRAGVDGFRVAQWE